MSPLSELLSPPDVWPHEGVAEWWKKAAPFASRGEPRDLALALGIRADRLAYAFAGGYLAALAALFPPERELRPGALCATEAGGVHPSAIQTRFANGRVTGDKTFVTLAHHAEVLYVLAREGERSDGRAQLALVKVEAKGSGVEVNALPELPFVPEIGHAAVRLDDAPALRLDGDGWSDYVRPFRTVEDAHVHLAYLAWQLGNLRRWDADEALIEEGLGIVGALRDVAIADPARAETHLALAAVIKATATFSEAVDWSLAPAVEAQRWQRDATLLRVASKAREKRRLRAWQEIRARGAAPAPR